MPETVRMVMTFIDVFVFFIRLRIRAGRPRPYGGCLCFVGASLVGARIHPPYTSPEYIPRIHLPYTSPKNIHMQLRNKPHANHSRVPQMSDDGLHLLDEIIFASGIAIHGLQFLLEHGTSLYPSVEVLHGALRLAVRTIEHGKF